MTGKSYRLFGSDKHSQDKTSYSLHYNKISLLQNAKQRSLWSAHILIMASARNIRCFFNEHAAKSFTTGWLLITISSSDMACFHPYVIHRGGFVKSKRHHRPSLFIGKLWHSGRWCHTCICVHVHIHGTIHQGETSTSCTRALLKHGSAFQSPKLSLIR